jgi:hypothetical protein
MQYEQLGEYYTLFVACLSVCSVMNDAILALHCDLSVSKIRKELNNVESQ